MNASGTWIDWQYLLDAASLLAKCRYTLQYTYPYAYYMELGPRKELVSILWQYLYEVKYL
jgi:ariadne-2